MVEQLVLLFMVALSLLLCAVGIVAAVLMAMLIVSALVDVALCIADLISKRGRRRARLLRRLSRNRRT